MYIINIGSILKMEYLKTYIGSDVRWCLYEKVLKGKILHVFARDVEIERLKSECETFKKVAPCIPFSISGIE